jgi:hypothetical protein
MNERRTTKTGKSAGGAKIETGSPSGHEELGSSHAAEQKGETNPPKPRRAAKKPAHELPPQNFNPKHPG